MRVAVLTVRLYAPWVHSLKEKRAEVKKLLGRLRARFNVSVCEAGDADLHQSIVLGVVAAAANDAQAESMLQNALYFIEGNTEAEVTVLERQVL